MTVLSAVKAFIATYPGLDAGAPLTTDHISGAPAPVWYNIRPMSGNPIIETYLNDRTRRQFPFAFQSHESTFDELERLDNIQFFEGFAEWLETQTAAGTLPTLDAGKTAESIAAGDWAYLFEQAQSETGIYQITCRLIYEQDAP